MPTGTTNPVFDVDLLSTNQYYPYGMVIEDLSWNTGDIRYGYGGTHEMDNEIKGGVGKHLILVTSVMTQELHGDLI